MTRRVFMHIDEYGEDGFAVLPHYICVSYPLVLWSPSALLLKTANKNNSTDLTPTDLLRLIDCQDAPIRVIGRREWFDPSWRKGHAFWGARWDSEFDTKLAAFAKEDETNSVENRRVMFASPERGYEMADEMLATPRAKSIYSSIGKLFAEGALPQGIMEKAQRDKDASRPYVRTVLRDFYNHEDAKEEARAIASASPCQHLLLLHKIVHGAGVTAVTTTEGRGSHADEGDIRDAAKILKRLPDTINRKILCSFLKSSMHKDLRDLFFSERGQKSIEGHLIDELKKVATIPPLLERIFPPGRPLKRNLTLGGMVYTLASFVMSGSPRYGLLPISYAVAEGTLMRSGVLSPVPKKHKTQSLLYLAFGKRRPSMRKIEGLCTWLGDT